MRLSCLSQVQSRLERNEPPRSDCLHTVHMPHACMHVCSLKGSHTAITAVFTLSLLYLHVRAVGVGFQSADGHIIRIPVAEMHWSRRSGSLVRCFRPFPPAWSPIKSPTFKLLGSCRNPICRIFKSQPLDCYPDPGRTNAHRDALTRCTKILPTRGVRSDRDSHAE